MSMPNLKRVKVSSVQELESWLKENTDFHQCVMLVTQADASHRKFISREQVGQTIEKHGWNAGKRYTLGSGLLGHVITCR